MLSSWKKSYDKPRQCIKKHRHHFANKGTYSQGYGLSSSHVWMWELDHKEGRALKNWGFQTVLLEKAFENPVDSKENRPVDPKGNQPWIFIGRTDAKAEAPILRLLDGKSQLIGKDPDAGKDWEQEEKKATEERLVGWHRPFKGHELGQTLTDGEGQGGLTSCSPWSHRELDTTWQLNSSSIPPPQIHVLISNSSVTVWGGGPLGGNSVMKVELSWMRLCCA